jgi:HD-GYP domain-containing protein (c-di-GMP phosphodiesterase class II)
MRSVACTAFAHEEAAIAAGDDVAARRLMSPFDASHDPRAAVQVLRRFGEWAPPLQHARLALGFVAGGRRFGDEMCLAHFDVGTRMAERLGMSAGVRAGLGQVWERWDGRGMPNGLRGEALPLATRVVHLTFVADVVGREGGVPAAAEVVRRRRGGHFDPSLCDTFASAAAELMSAAAAESAWEAVLAAEPEPVLVSAAADDAAGVLADFADLKTPFTLGHAGGVAALVQRAAALAGLEEGAAAALGQSALVQDLGRVSVRNGVWEKASSLTAADWEQVRLHPYWTERVLAYSPQLAPLGRVASMHHERLDGSGYHRGVRAPELPLGARLLAAADVYQALLEARPHRPPATAEGARRELCAEADAGRLDPEAAEAVLAAAGQEAPRRTAAWPRGLTDREVEVLRLVARGLRSKQVARELGISIRTVNHHIAHAYEKTGVRSRAGIALFAMEHGLLTDRPA